jgi:hypothetical protein
MNVNQLNIRGTKAVLALREEKLRNDIPFMINAKELPTNQAYLEYPNGTVKLVSLTKGARHFTLVKELTKEESFAVINENILSLIEQIKHIEQQISNKIL